MIALRLNRTLSPLVALLTLGLSSTLLGCGSAHDALRPEQPTAAEAMGRATIKAVDGASSPLVVDWKAEDRADLEESVHDGIAIVAWDDKGLRLLKRCHLTGDYGYLPVQVKKDVVRLESADEVRASLPLGGLGIAGKIGGGFESGKTIDIALAMVGKRRTTWGDVAASDLTGTCEGATHYVRAILVGAFVMKTGTRAKEEAAVEIFGAGVNGGSASSKEVSSTDGKVEDCDRATGEEKKPPGQCSAILRIELEPLSKGGSTKPAPKADQEPTAEAAQACPEGFVFAKGACHQSKPDLPHLCAPGDAVDCKAQCDKGSAASCNRLGSLIASGKAPAKDPGAAAAAFDKACQGGEANGCTNLGISLLWGGNKDTGRAVKSLDLGCRMGSARACELAGEAWMNGTAGTKDVARAVKLYSKGCEGGDYVACTNAGFLFTGAGGAAVERNDELAIAFGRRACFGGEAVACGNIGYKVELGEGVKANPQVASVLYDRACKLSSPECFRSGMLFAFGAAGVTKDDKKSKAFLEQSCKAGSGLNTISCVVATALYGSAQAPNKHGLEHTVSIMKGQCDQKEGRACAFLGIAEYGLGQKGDAQRDLKLSCSFKDNLGCELARRLK
jgi:hypothetical protein